MPMITNVLSIFLLATVKAKRLYMRLSMAVTYIVASSGYLSMTRRGFLAMRMRDVDLSFARLLVELS